MKGKSVRDLGIDSDNTMYINESLSFDTKALLYDTRVKCKTLGYSKIISDNGIIKVKVHDGNGVSWWAKIKQEGSK